MSGHAYVRTTVLLREDFYEKLKREGGTLSGQINALLEKRFHRKRRSLFGTTRRTSLDDLRDHHDRM